MTRIISIAFLACCLGACRQPQEPLTFQQNLILDRDHPFDILVDDVNADGRRDVAAVSHGGNYMRVFYQQEGRTFTSGPEISEVGFHPGMIARWPGKEPRYLLNAEGKSKLLLMTAEPDLTFLAAGEIAERAPRYSTFFTWPNWGTGLAVSPFSYDTLVLWKNLDFENTGRSERYALPLSAKGHANVTAGRPLAVDIDSDHVEEILFAVSDRDELRVVRAPGHESKPVVNTLYKFNGGAQEQFAALDLNGDGAIDLLVPDQTTPFEVHVLINDGHGKFQETASLKFPTSMGVRAVDARQDKDGVNTALIVGYGALVLYRFPPAWDTKSPVPQFVQPFPPYEASQSIVLRDIDGDGWLDAVVGRGLPNKGMWLVFGPLEKNFQTLIERKFYLQ